VELVLEEFSASDQFVFLELFGICANVLQELIALLQVGIFY